MAYRNDKDVADAKKVLARFKAILQTAEAANRDYSIMTKSEQQMIERICEDVVSLIRERYK